MNNSTGQNKGKEVPQFLTICSLFNSYNWLQMDIWSNRFGFVSAVEEEIESAGHKVAVRGWNIPSPSSIHSGQLSGKWFLIGKCSEERIAIFSFRLKELAVTRKRLMGLRYGEGGTNGRQLQIPRWLEVPPRGVIPLIQTEKYRSKLFLRIRAQWMPLCFVLLEKELESLEFYV